MQESKTGTVAPDFLSGIYGGITMAQYRLRDGAIVDDIQLTQDHPAHDIIRHVGQLG